MVESSGVVEWSGVVGLWVLGCGVEWDCGVGVGRRKKTRQLQQTTRCTFDFVVLIAVGVLVDGASQGNEGTNHEIRNAQCLPSTTQYLELQDLSLPQQQ